MTSLLAPLAVLATALRSRLLLRVRAVPAALRLLARAVVPPRLPGPPAGAAWRAWGAFLARWALRALLHLLAPPACAACDAPSRGAPLGPDATFCAACEATLAPAEPPAIHDGPAFDEVASGAYRGALAAAVRRFKYGGRPDLAGPLGARLAAAIHDAGLRADLVVPVPLHPRKLRERGYNQAALLAGAVARAAGARVAARGLRRTRDTTAQASLSRRGRLDNLADAFRVRAPGAIRGKRVLLVDDVATTGATLRACAAALLGAGAASVTAVVLARADAPNPSREPGFRAG